MIGSSNNMAHKNSKSSGKMFLGMLLFWLAVGAVVVVRIVYFDQISARATSETSRLLLTHQ